MTAEEESVISFVSSSEASLEEEAEESTEERSPPGEKKDDSDSSSPALAHKETVAVNRSKLLVYAVLLLTAAVAAGGTYMFVRRGEENDFEQQFNNNAQEIIRGSEENSKSIFGDAIKISDALTSYALATNATWPFVTLPDFEIATTPPFETSAGAELVLFAPKVARKDRQAFEQYAHAHQDWIQRDLENRGLSNTDPGKIPEEIYYVTKDDDVETDFSAPLWQIGPAPTNATIILKDLYSQASFRRMIDDVLIDEKLLLSESVDQESLERETEGVNYFSRGSNQPSSYAALPVFDGHHKNKEIVGFLFTVVPWDIYFQSILSNAAQGILVEVEDTCGPVFSYQVDGPRASFNGNGRLDTSSEFRDLKHTTDFAEFARFTGAAELEYLQFCNYRLSVYPSAEYKDQFMSDQPILFAGAVALIFMFTSFVFALYDFMVSRRQKKVMLTATRTTAIVKSLFPKNVQERILEGAEPTMSENRFSFGHKNKLRAFLHGDDDDGNFESKPIADLFPQVTIMFADIVGFTAWSSTREPSQVFTLLETIFSAFDKIARKRGVFKVETVGDCYVAVCGLPDANPRHAQVMARFASDCCSRFNNLVKQLEISLGPDTADLGMRLGMHSGPVTAGVLRGERSRFQLFGDSMNVAARMESTGIPGRIQVSQTTYDILKENGKGHWLTERPERVEVKGKGELKTYFVLVHGKASSAVSDSTLGSSSGNKYPEGNIREVPNPQSVAEKNKRLVKWNSDILVGMLRELAAMRKARGAVPDDRNKIRELESETTGTGVSTLEQVAEYIPLPTFDPRVAARMTDPESILIDDVVVQEASHYVAAIASMYRFNPFHNMEHASHVSMSVVKLFSRIVAPEQQHADSHATLHDHTYGITSDPLTRFAVFFAALIHDVDHQGVPNTQLVKESSALADCYSNKSVAEQNSIDLSWSLLMEDEFQNLRRAIYDTEEEFQRFRQLVLNVVLATDIMDKDLKALRNDRWEKAFSEKAVPNQDNEGKRGVDRKATIVMEHLIQASDVAHTMQHWHIYIKWNERLFMEMAKAYAEGRAEKHPVDFWYKGEIGFFDFYIIPLAKKLRNCGVFGVSSDEYLSYAQANRHEWEIKGQQIVSEYMEKLSSTKSE